MNIASFDPNEIDQDEMRESQHNRHRTNYGQSQQDNQVNFVFEPPCGNGIDEELFDKVVDVLEKQDCDKKGPQYSLYNTADMEQIQANKYNKIRYNMNEGFGSDTNPVYIAIAILLFVMLLYYLTVHTELFIKH